MVRTRRNSGRLWKRRLNGQRFAGAQVRSSAMAAETEMRFEFLLQELSECRQDDRDSINQILSVIAAGIAAVVIVANVLTEGGGENANAPVMEALRGNSTWILLGIVVTAFSYVLSLGLRSSLRYSYMRMLCKEIKDCGAGDVPGWVEMSAPLITLNPRHIKSNYTLIHFLGIFCAIVAAIAVCVSMVSISATGDDLHAGVLAAAAIFFILFTCAVFAMSDAQAIMNKMKKLVEERREQDAAACEKQAVSDQGGVAGKDPNWLRFALYLVYPHPQDALKLLFLLFGFVLGWFVADRCDSLLGFVMRFLLLLFVFDVFGYQARYQINDIRGYHEDEKNPAAEKRGRLASFGVPERVSVFSSAAAALAKIALGMVVIALVSPDDDIRVALFISFALVFVLAFVYECARSPRKGKAADGKLHEFLPLALVGLGYMLRIGTGIACGGGVAVFSPGSAAFSALVLVLVASVPFGWSFVGITWMLECCAARYRTDGAYHKTHIEFLYQRALRRCGSSPAPASYYRPLKRRNSFRNVWNWSLVVSVGLMVTASLLFAIVFGGDCQQAWFTWEFALMAVVLAFLLAGVVVYLVCPERFRFGVVVLAVVVALCIGWILWLLHVGCLRGCACPTVLLGAAVYVSVCLFFENANYFEMADFAQGLRFAFSYRPRAIFGRLFRWPKDEERARERVKSVKDRLKELDKGVLPETDATKAERERLKKEIIDALQVYTDGFKTGKFFFG